MPNENTPTRKIAQVVNQTIPGRRRDSTYSSGSQIKADTQNVDRVYLSRAEPPQRVDAISRKPAKNEETKDTRESENLEMLAKFKQQVLEQENRLAD